MTSASSKKTDSADRRPTEWVESPTPECVSELVGGEISELVAGLLARRGITTASDARAFLEPSLAQLHDPLLLDGMSAAVDRLMRARASGEKVAIVGDYDVDGVSATALLTAVFQACKLTVEAILPHRMRDGYGLQQQHVERAREGGASVIVTADCGSQALDPARRALEAGIDVVVTDHHLTDQEHDPRVIHLNPHRPECRYPFTDLSGAGLAYKLATAFADAAGRPIAPELLLRVACLGTIADMVPLRGENRTIAALGLRSLPASRSVGLRALMQVAGVRGKIRAGDVGFRLGPRLNAAGRMDGPDSALDLLLTRDPDRARTLAAQLDELNRERQRTEERVVEQAAERWAEATDLPRILVAWDSGWHRGVVGIAASRISRRFHRPTILLAVEGEQATGSGRSIDGLHLHDFLHRWSDQMERFGGHSQAIGLTVRTDRLEELRAEWIQSSADWDDSILTRRRHYEQPLGAGRIDDALRSELERLEPFGVGNPRPVFLIGPLTTKGEPRLFGNGHVALTAVDDHGDPLHLLAWRWADRRGEFGGRFEILGKIAFDSFSGRTVVEVVDLREAGSSA